MPRSRNEPTKPGSFKPTTTKKGNPGKARFIVAVKGVERELAKISKKNFRGNRREIEKRLDIVKRNIEANILTVDKDLGTSLLKKMVKILRQKSSEKNENFKSFKDFIRENE